MRYPNPDDKPEVECYECCDRMTPTEYAIRLGDTWLCVFCVVTRQEYDIEQGRQPQPLPVKARRVLKAHVERVNAALRYPLASK